MQRLRARVSCTMSLGIAGILGRAQDMGKRSEPWTVRPADVNSMVGLISGWLGGALASAAERPNEDEDTVGGLSQALAEILASLQATFAGTPLDVEISYEGGRGVSIRFPVAHVLNA